MNVADADSPRIAVIGGGLAGLAASLALAERKLHVHLFEAKRTLGGRAGSFLDPQSGERVDHCQHVAMGCCTNYRDFCRRTGIEGDFHHEHTLHFLGPDGRRYDVAAARGLPAPLHLGPSLLRLGYLSLWERIGVSRALLQLAREPQEQLRRQTMLAWLQARGQSARAIDRFWSVVLVSALGETVDRVSAAMSRKVFVDGFMAASDAYVVEVPARPLGELYDVKVAGRLRGLGVRVHLETPARRVGLCAEHCHGRRRFEVELSDGVQPYDFVILALPWRQATRVLDSDLAEQLPEVSVAEEISSSPITAFHLWYDRALTDLSHAVLIDRLSQWLFRRGEQPPGHYYQVVISASRDLSGRPREELLQQITDDVATVFPRARGATLLRHRMVTQRDAVFSCTSEIEDRRPTQATQCSGLILSGDWTDTGWPATMEGAVRSGYLAAEAVLAQSGRSENILTADLPQGWLARFLTRSA